MTENAIGLKRLCKEFKEFALKDVSFTVPKGYITGLVGENGAGKTTLLNLIMQVMPADAGEIEIEDQKLKFRDIKLLEDIYIIFDESYLNEELLPKEYDSVLKAIYKNWDSKKYRALTEQFSLPENKAIKTFSKGMKVKLNFAMAFAANTNTLLLDEATSGLDPMIRDDILDLLLNYVQDENHTVLFSSHIVTDLEKIADKIIFLHNGKVLLEEFKDNLLYEYGVLHCSKEECASIHEEDKVACLHRDYDSKVLVKDKEQFMARYPELRLEAPTLEEIIVLLGKGTER